MALQVWLPLNGNLNNQGLSNVTITNNGATVDNNGKIGKCYYFDGTDDRISCSALTIKYPMSIAGWFKPTNVTASATQYWISYNTNTGGTDGHSIGIGTYNGIPAVWYNGGMSNLSTSLSNNVWYHIAVTIDENKKVAVYLNGASVATFTSTATQPNSTWITLGARSNSSTGGAGGAAYYYKGYMNDARVYDSCLSAREIEILSRGLVAHYPLNGGGRGRDNLLKNTGDLTLWAKEAGITTTWDSEKNLYKIVDSTHTSSRWGIYQDINIEANTSYTITCTLNGDNCAVAFGFYDSSTSFPGNLITVTDSTTKRLSYTVTSGASSTKARVYLNMNCANSATKTAWFGTPKVEKGSVSTPWIPNSTDAAYSAMGYNSTTEYDVSGYGYNGTKNGTIAYSSDTARYSVCSVFNGTDNCIQIPLNSFFPNASTFTVNLWFKKTSLGSKGYESLWGGISGFEMDTRQGTAETLSLYMAQTRGGNLYPSFDFNKWYMVTMVCDGTNELYYVNGSLVSTITKKGMPSGNYWIGSWRDASSQNFKGQISDFRIYATALSATQIAELYNTAVSVANNGALLGYELIET